jgi:hypothetical protein
MLLVSNLGTETIISMLLVSKPTKATVTTKNKQVPACFLTEILARNLTQKKRSRHFETLPKHTIPFSHAQGN